MPAAAGRRDDLECAPRCSAHHQRNLIFIFVFQKRLRAFLEHFFTGGVVKMNGSCGDTPSVIAYGDATFPKGTAFGGGGKHCGSARKASPWGSCRAATEGVCARQTV